MVLGRAQPVLSDILRDITNSQLINLSTIILTMMAAAVLRRKTNSFRDLRFPDDELDDRPIYLREFPRSSSALKDLILGVLLGRHAIHESRFCSKKLTFPNCRTWRERRVVYTNEVIAFAAVGKDILLDAIPLSEVISIDLMKDDHSDEQHHLHNSYEAAIDFTHAFQIRTQKNGQNAGRKYVIRADSDLQADMIVSELNQLYRIAAEQAEARSRWGKVQSRVRSFYDSSAFQGVSAILIVVVRFFFCYGRVIRLPVTLFSSEFSFFSGRSSNGKRVALQPGWLNDQHEIEPGHPEQCLHHNLHHRAPHQHLRPLDQRVHDESMVPLRHRGCDDVPHRFGPPQLPHQHAARLARRATLRPPRVVQEDPVGPPGGARPDVQRILHHAHRGHDV